MSAILAVGGPISGCGADDGASDEQALEARIAEERADAAEEARQRQRVEELEEDLRDLENDASAQSTDADSSSSSASSETALSFEPYVSPDGGWQASVPSGDGWSDGVETQLNPGLHRTTFTGPAGAVLIVDSTPAETPVYNGPAARSTASHPVYDGVEKLIFKGNTSVTPCETAVCVDFLIPVDSGGYAVLAGGPGDFAEFEGIAEAVALSLRSL